MSRNRLDLLHLDATASMAAVRELFEEYARSLSVDLCFQNFAAELATLPGEYLPPGGSLVLARYAGADAGCGALRALVDCDYPNACEMKRVYLRPQFRGKGFGRQLAMHLIDQARTLGYSCVLLDTLDDMESARGLYDSLGFYEVPPYYFNPLPGAHYLKVDL